jgi:hypothetical protein
MADEPEKGPPSGQGVFIPAGTRVVIPAGGLTIGRGDDGKFEASVTVNLNYDVIPTWLRIALRHLTAAEESRRAVLVAWTGDAPTLDASQQAKTIEAEFQAAMQAIVAAAVALDAFYTTVEKLIEVPEALRATWRANKTSRYARMSEVFRIAFEIGPRSTVQLRGFIKWVMGLRDRAVHPTSNSKEAVLHPVLGRAMEWRLVTFRLEMAQSVVGNSLSAIVQLAGIPKRKFPALKEQCHYHLQSLLPLMQEWESRYGALKPEPISVDSQDEAADASNGGPSEP